MQGRILAVNIAEGQGTILGNDGNRYSFTSAEWRTAEPPVNGMAVDYLAADGAAREVFPLPGQPGAGAGPQAGVATGQPAAFAAAAQPRSGSDNSVVLGWIGVALLVLGFLIPVLPTIAAFIIGLIGADSGKKNHNSTGVILSRVAWIGSLVIMVAGLLLIIFGLQVLAMFAGTSVSEILNGNWSTNT